MTLSHDQIGGVPDDVSLPTSRPPEVGEAAPPSDQSLERLVGLGKATNDKALRATALEAIWQWQINGRGTSGSSPRRGTRVGPVFTFLRATLCYSGTTALQVCDENAGRNVSVFGRTPSLPGDFMSTLLPDDDLEPTSLTSHTSLPTS